LRDVLRKPRNHHPSKACHVMNGSMEGQGRRIAVPAPHGICGFQRDGFVVLDGRGERI
jgi:hypothetical protein